MIYFFVKNWKLFLDILLVVGGLIAFTLWDPIGMFSNAKTKQTANLVSGVRDIGQLVTAEYHGEVISSWKEFRLTEFPSDTLTDYASETFQDIKYLIWENRGRPNRMFNNIQQSDTYKSFRKNPAYDELITFLSDKYLSFKLNNIYKNEKLVPNVEEKLYKKLLDEILSEAKNIKKELGLRKRDWENEEFVSEIETYLFDTPEFIFSFFPYYQFLVKREDDKEKKNIVFIGRGSIKAGFDFGELNESNFLYDEESKTVSFYGLKPTILDADINPWFIPERKVKGFELISHSGRVNFEEAKLVKKQCKEKLLNQARKAAIIDRAEKNGVEALKNFFSLLLDEPDLKVSFHTHPYDRLMAIIGIDSLVDLEETLVIDSLYQAYLIDQSVDASEAVKGKSTQHLQRLIENLKSLSFLDLGNPFSYYSIAMGKSLMDNYQLDSMDVEEVNELRGVLASTVTVPPSLTTSFVAEHPIWFDQNFRKEFNEGIKALLMQGIVSTSDSISLSDLRFPEGNELASLDTEKWKQEVALIDQVQNAQEIHTKKLKPISSIRSGVTAFIERLKK